MNSLGDELRLLIFVVVQALVLFAGWRFVSRFVADTLQRMIDTLMLVYVIQYVAVGLPGMFGFLSPIAMLGIAVFVSIGMLLLTPSPGTPGEGGGEGSALPSYSLANSQQNPHPNLLPAYREKGPEYLLPLVGGLFVLGYVAAVVWQLRLFPPMATDALTYHLPAAVQWLQHGRIDLFQTWFFNPANTYSPLAGSTFYAWLLGPIGNDTLAHFAAAPMVVLIFLTVVSMSRSLGAGWGSAVLLGVAVALCRPIVSQIDKGKDDLFLAAFFAMAVNGLSQTRLRDRLGPWRIGTSIGLCLAIKYTALLAMPMLLLAIDSPFRARWRWRDYLMALVCVVLLAGPWYVRNIVLTGNPLFPADFLWFSGIIKTAPSLELRSFAGVLGVFFSGPFAIPGALCLVLICGWSMAVGFGVRRLLHDPLLRACLLGPVIGLVVFVAYSPYPEIRFVVPALLLMMASLGAIGTRWSWIPAGLVALAAVATGLSAELWATLLTFCVVGGAVALLGVGAVWLQSHHLHLRRDGKLIVAGVTLLLLMGYTYVNWYSFIADRESIFPVALAGDDRVKIWKYVRDELPAGEPIAYTGTFTVYPLMGFKLDRPVHYAPIRPKVKTLADLPHLGDVGQRLAGEQIATAVVRVTTMSADRAVWLANLHDSGAAHLVVFTNEIQPVPIEKSWAEEMPDRFKLEYADNAGAVYRVLQVGTAKR